MILSLDEIIQIDKSVLEIADLPLGSIAIRKSKTDNWTIKRK